MKNISIVAVAIPCVRVLSSSMASCSAATANCTVDTEYARCVRASDIAAIVTADGRIWNIVEQPVSVDLVHDDMLCGKRVRIRGRVFRVAGTIEISTYQIL